jgi:hypothetical protein
MGSVTSEYPICTGWVLHRFPVPQIFMGRQIIVRVTVVQPGGVVVPVTLHDEAGVPFQTTRPEDNGLATSLALDNVRFERPDEDPNLAPIAEILEVAGSEGTAIVVRSTSSDPDGTITSFEWGGPSTCQLASATRSRVLLTCPDNGSHLVSFKVTDNGGRATTVLRRIEVRNVIPRFETAFQGVPVAIRTGASFPAGLDFSDKGTADTHTAMWSFNSLTAVPGTIIPGAPGTFSRVQDLLVAPAPGIYKLRLQVHDDDGGMRALAQDLAVFDATAGRVEGNGSAQIYSTPFSIAASVAYADANATLPAGSLIFSAPEKGIIEFEATTIDYLVVTSNATRAIIAGNGIRNGEPGYSFRVEINDPAGLTKPVQLRFTVTQLDVPKGYAYSSPWFPLESGTLRIAVP